MVPLSFARQRGLDPLTMPRDDVIGVGGIVPTRYSNVALDFPGIGLVIDVYAGFSDGIGLGLLGQNGFFEKVKVQFDRAAHQFYIEF